ncbi:hypothetical protein [Vibrio alginolyticus]|uniref:hypothetical protein n=1 Tax=Vibrio alginolyticus TaxID=663 RepID=UPI001C3C5964|nr:hypothetical protein [Vibrio alginolyticus]
MAFYDNVVHNFEEVMQQLHDFLNTNGCTIRRFNLKSVPGDTRNYDGRVYFSFPGETITHGFRAYQYNQYDQVVTNACHFLFAGGAGWDASADSGNGDFTNGSGWKGNTHYDGWTARQNTRVTFPTRMRIITDLKTVCVVHFAATGQPFANTYGVGIGAGIGAYKGQKIPWCDGVGGYVNSSTNRYRTMFGSMYRSSGSTYYYRQMAGACLIPESPMFDDWNVGDGAKWCPFLSENTLGNQGVPSTRIVQDFMSRTANSNDKLGVYTSIAPHIYFEPSLTTVLLPCATCLVDKISGTLRSVPVVDFQGVKFLNPKYVGQGEQLTHNNVQYRVVQDIAEVDGSSYIGHHFALAIRESSW